ncbi:hypothetical protein KKA53_04870 [Candidatus Dependentiae bacterium]|nr:hypothetical protein [Candidatus Dependentiae bacterium]
MFKFKQYGKGWKVTAKAIQARMERAQKAFLHRAAEEAKAKLLELIPDKEAYKAYRDSIEVFQVGDGEGYVIMANTSSPDVILQAYRLEWGLDGEPFLRPWRAMGEYLRAQTRRLVKDGSVRQAVEGGGTVPEEQKISEGDLKEIERWQEKTK